MSWTYYGKRSPTETGFYEVKAFDGQRDVLFYLNGKWMKHMGSPHTYVFDICYWRSYRRQTDLKTNELCYVKIFK